MDGYLDRIDLLADQSTLSPLTIDFTHQVSQTVASAQSGNNILNIEIKKSACFLIGALSSLKGT